MVLSSCYSPVESRRLSDGRIINPFAPSYPDRRGSGYGDGDGSGRRGGSGMSTGYSQSLRDSPTCSIMGDQDGGHESSSSQRKRIAVACVRCRKRKIRCSGDNGTGNPCINCRNSGYEGCQFLRVSSQETPLRMSDSFSYGLDVSRQFQARSASLMPPVTHPLSPYGENMPLSAEESLHYRGSPVYGYGSSKSAYPVAGYGGGYADDGGAGHSSGGVEYAMYPASYQPVQDPSYMMSYRLGPNGHAAKPDGGTMYLDPETGYGYSSGLPTGSGLVHRPAQTGESGSFSFQTVAHGLTTSLGNGDRQLPIPIRRPLPSSAPRPYRADSVSSGYSKESGGTSSPNTLTEPASNYSTYDNSSSHLSSYAAVPTSATSSLTAAATSQLARSNDLYTTSSSGSSSADSMLGASDLALRMHGGATTASDMQYRYTDTTRRDSGPPYLPSASHHGGSYIGYGGGAAAVVADDERKAVASLRS